MTIGYGSTWRSRPHRWVISPRAAMRLLESGFCVIVLGAGLYAFASYTSESESFHVRNIRVDGTKLLTKDQVLQAAGVYTTDNLMHLESDVVMDRVRRAPYVEACSVTRVFPDTLVIHIDERTPVAVLLSNNKMYEIDGAGVVLGESLATQGVTQPCISEAPELGPLEAGVAVEQECLRAALEVLRQFSATEMAKEVTISEIAAPSLNAISMFCDELPYQIIWGRNDFESQARRLDVLWKEKGQDLRCAEYLDLRFGRDIACK